MFITPNCGFYTVGHPLDSKRRNAGLEYAKPITVGNNVWFGAGVHVMPGVTIGNDVVIAAGSVVTKDISSGVVAAGIPCRVVKKNNRAVYTIGLVFSFNKVVSGIVVGITVGNYSLDSCTF